MKGIGHDPSEPEPVWRQRTSDWWLPGALRVVTVAQALFVSVIAGTGLLRVVVPLVVLGAAATFLDATRRTRRWMPGLEAVVAGLVVGTAGESGVLGLSYLVVPGFSAGLRGGVASGLVVALAAGAAFLSGQLVLAQPVNSVDLIGGALQWGTLAIILALLGGWGYRQQGGRPPEDAAYLTASRLLDELRELTPQLTAGLDVTRLADDLLDEIAGRVPVDRAAVLLRTRTAARVVASRRANDEWLNGLETGAVPPGAPVIVLPDDERAPQWVVVQARGDVSAARQRIADVVSRYMLRLDAAQTFAEVREIAAKEERMRIAREIHDGVAQDLASLAYEVDEMSATAYDDQSVAVAAVGERVRALVRDLRLSIFDLRSDLPEQGVVVSVPEHARRTAAAADIDLRLSVRDSDSVLEPRAERELAFIAQEAITNVRKHAQAATLWVEIVHEADHCSITVRDDGVGVDEALASPTSSGLRIMRERARSIGAEVLVTNRLGGGTVVRVEYGGTRGRR